MIKEIQMWCIECDACEKQFYIHDGMIALNDKSAMEDEIIDADDWNITTDEKTYCGDCHELIHNDVTDEFELHMISGAGNRIKFLGIQK